MSRAIRTDAREARRSRSLLACFVLLATVTAASARPTLLPRARAFAGAAAVPRAAAPGDTAASDEPVPPSGVHDPLLELLIAVAEHDSLGAWDNRALTRYVAATGRQSMLPLAEIARVSRRVATPAEEEVRRGARVARVWEIDLVRVLRLPLPYSFLGYHPGTIAASQRLIISEWRLGDQNLHVASGKRIQRFEISDMLVFRIDDGWLVLDVDGWLDTLLGGLLDDYWTDGFVLGRREGHPIEVSLLVKRNGNADYGQFDLGHDRIIAHPEAVARGLNFLARPWVAPRAGSARRAWGDGAAAAVTP